MKIAFTIFLILGSFNTWALPAAPHNALLLTQTKSLKNIQSTNYDFEGIVKLSNCSGALIAFHGQPMSAPAIVMTNGHCIQKTGGHLNPGEHWVNRTISRSMKIFDRHFKLHDISSRLILFATMTNTDVAFYELNESYDHLYARTNILPLVMDPSRPNSGLSIDIISGYWDRGYSCQIDDFIFMLKEAAWTFTDSIRYTKGCDTIGGTSGSPIIARGERRVVGINNTSNTQGQTCTINNPCEVNEQGEIESVKGRRYGQQTFNLYSCLTPNFDFELEREGCEF